MEINVGEYKVFLGSDIKTSAVEDIHGNFWTADECSLSFSGTEKDADGYVKYNFSFKVPNQ